MSWFPHHHRIYFSIFKISKVQINQTLFLKLKWGSIKPCAFDCHVEPQLASEVVLKSKLTVLMANLVPLGQKGSTLYNNVESFMLKYTMFLKEISQEIVNGKKLDNF